MNFSTPHTVIVRRPAVTRNAGTNATEQDYDEPKKVGAVIGFMVLQDGRNTQTADGMIVPQDAIWYMHRQTIELELNDSIDFNGTVYLVHAINDRYDLAGKFSHHEVALTKELRR